MSYVQEIAQAFKSVYYDVAVISGREFKVYNICVLSDAMERWGYFLPYHDPQSFEYNAVMLRWLCDEFDLLLHEYCRGDQYDDPQAVGFYDGYYDAARFGYEGVIMHDLS